MTFQSIVLHPTVRLVRIVLSVWLATYFVWLLWSGGHAGYGTWTCMLCLTAWNFVGERAKMANGS